MKIKGEQPTNIAEINFDYDITMSFTDAVITTSVYMYIPSMPNGPTTINPTTLQTKLLFKKKMVRAGTSQGRKPPDLVSV